MPFPRNPDFVGRTDDLARLHATLQQREPVGIRPAGLIGMGGIGKTQLAVEYVYRFNDAYPHGIFWINAAEPLAKGLAPIGSRLRPQVLERPPDEQLRVAFDELKHRPGALLVFDNLEDPAQLARPVGAGGKPAHAGLPHPLHHPPARARQVPAHRGFGAPGGARPPVAPPG